MNSHNIYFHDKMRNIPEMSLNICFKLSVQFLWASKRVQASHGKRVIGVRVIKALLCHASSMCLGVLTLQASISPPAYPAHIILFRISVLYEYVDRHASKLIIFVLT